MTSLRGVKCVCRKLDLLELFRLDKRRMLACVWIHKRAKNKCFKVPYEFCNDYTGNLGGPILVHRRIFRSDGEEMTVQQLYISFWKVWRESIRRCDFLIWNRVSAQCIIDKIRRSPLKDTTKHNAVWLFPFVSLSPPRFPHYFLLAPPLPPKAAILSSHLPEISDRFSFTKFSLKESSSAQNRPQSVMPVIQTASRYPTRYH